MTCESKVQVVVALGQLLQSENVFELGGITKDLMTGPSGNSEFCFPSTSMFPSASPRGTLRVSGKQNSLFPLGPVIKCLIFTSTSSR